jgi:hypothetical protein
VKQAPHIKISQISVFVYICCYRVNNDLNKENRNFRYKENILWDAVHVQAADAAQMAVKAAADAVPVVATG